MSDGSFGWRSWLPIVEMIAQGRQPAELTTEMLTRRMVLPPEWEAQKRLLAM
jgi:hypothetical protein